MRRIAFCAMMILLITGFSPLPHATGGGGFLDLNLDGDVGIDVAEDPDIVRERERREAEERRRTEEEARRQAEAEAARIREEAAEARRKEAEARRIAQAEARAARAAASVGGGAALSPNPPAVTPEVIFAGYLGGKGDQTFTEVEIRDNQIRARGGRLSLQVILNAQGRFREAIPSGNINENMELPQGARGTPQRAQLANSNVTYGYRQVHPILQQPYVNIGNDITLWGWNNEQARDAKGRFAPYMSDSRIQFVEHGPVIDGKKTYFIVGWSDGGNTCFQGDARDRHTGSRMRGNLNTGGGSGSSSWIWLFNEDGEQVHPGIALRGLTHGVKFDSWGRPIIWGGGISKWDGPNPFNIMADGGSLMMLSQDWSRWEFRQPMAAGVITAVEFDEISGIFAACGYTRNTTYTSSAGRERKAREFGQTNPVQTKPGDRYDAFLVVWRMWQPLRRMQVTRGDAFDDPEPKEGTTESSGGEAGENGTTPDSGSALDSPASAEE